MAKSEDIQLVQEVLNGNVRAFETLVGKYQSMVFTLVYRILDNSFEAEEVAQDVFVKVYSSLASFQQKSSFSTWLYRIAYNESINRQRQNQAKKQLQTTSLDGVFETGFWDEAHDGGKQGDKKLIESCLNELSETDKYIVTLYYYEDKPLKEIAVIVSLTESNIKARLHRSRQKLYDLLHKHQEHLISSNYE